MTDITQNSETPSGLAGISTLTEIAPMQPAEIIALAFGDSLEEQETERRLLELGFVEGAQISVLHEGLFGRDPLVLMVDDARIALRRAQARCIKVRTLE